MCNSRWVLLLFMLLFGAAESVDAQFVFINKSNKHKECLVQDISHHISFHAFQFADVDTILVRRYNTRISLAFIDSMYFYTDYQNFKNDSAQGVYIDIYETPSNWNFDVTLSNGLTYKISDIVLDRRRRASNYVCVVAGQKINGEEIGSGAIHLFKGRKSYFDVP